MPTSPPPRPPPPEIPKSPPKWPLRPGVMVHVKSDTKLSASRTQSPASVAQNANTSNVSYASPILSQSLRTTSQPSSGVNVSGNREIVIDLSPKSPPTLPSRNLLDKFQAKVTTANDTQTRECADGIEDHNGSTVASNNEELINFTSSSLIERILGRLRWRRQRTKRNSVDGETDDGNVMTKSNKRAVNLIRGATGWFGSGKSTNSSTGLFDKRHQFSGITCSDGGKYNTHAFEQRYTIRTLK